MGNLLKLDELLALRCETPESYQECVAIYTQGRADGYFASAGRRTAIIPKVDEQWLRKSLEDRGFTAVREMPLQSILELSSSEAATVRRPGFRDNPADREARLKELRSRREARQAKERM